MDEEQQIALSTIVVIVMIPFQILALITYHKLDKLERKKNKIIWRNLIMALIFCRNCGNQISDKAPSCPHCGAVVSVVQQSEPIIYGSPIQKPKKHGKVIVGVIVALIAVASIIAAILIPVKLEADEHKKGTVTEYRASSVGTLYDGGYNDTYTVHLTVSLKNAFTKKVNDLFADEQEYSEVSILVDGEEIGTMSIGDQRTFDCNLALGNHNLEVVAKTETRVRYSDTIDVTGNNDSFTYKLKCTNNAIKVPFF